MGTNVMLQNWQRKRMKLAQAQCGHQYEIWHTS